MFRCCILISFLLFFISCGGSGSSNSIVEEDFKILNVGRSPLALTAETFECDDFIFSIEDLPTLHIAFLFNTFGNNFECLARLLADKRMRSLVVHLINEPGHRNNRLGAYEFLSSISSPEEYDRLLRTQNQQLKNKYIQYVQPMIELTNRLPSSVACIISPGLESNLRDTASRILIEWTRELFPEKCQILWNPLRETEIVSASQVGANLVEAHGKEPLVAGACTINTDGTDIEFIGRPNISPSGKNIQSGSELENYILRWSSVCEIVFLWVVEDNCLRPGSFIDPRKRNCSVAIETNINHLLSDEILRIIK
jgi:hypothetical protein